MRPIKFNPQDDCIICRAEIFGKDNSLVFKMIIDTGATYTMVLRSVLSILSNVKLDHIIEITTGSRTEKLPLIILPTFKALNIAVHNFPVIIHDLPPRCPVEGLLGLNFLKKSKAIIDFSRNSIKIP